MRSSPNCGRILQDGDIVIDGGNSHFTDTERRVKELAGTGIKFFGMGVSGGEEGALWGPSLMPGGDEESYKHLEPILKKIAAKTADDGPCVTYIGSKGAGHFVKMVHNGIEYGDMQLIAEAYDLLKNVAGLNNQPAQGRLQRMERRGAQELPDRDHGEGDRLPRSRKSESRSLVDMILDKAGQKGTGKWTTQSALDLGVPIPTITAAVDARGISALKDERVKASKLLAGPKPASIKGDVQGVHQ